MTNKYILIITVFFTLLNNIRAEEGMWLLSQMNLIEKDMQNKGISNDVLRKIIIPGLGYKLDTLPKNILELIEG